jgi:hypothetical protein
MQQLLENIRLTPELVYFMEALKVEGYWSTEYSNWNIQNKNLCFIRHIEDILKTYFGEIRLKKKILLKIEPSNQNFSKEDVNLRLNDIELPFHIANSEFSKTNKIIAFLPHEKQQSAVLRIKGRVFPISIRESEEEFVVTAPFRGWAYCDLKLYDKDMQKVVISLLKKKELMVEPFLFDADKQLVAAAFSALVDAEGNLSYYGLTRKLLIRMRKPTYLEGWKTLLKTFGIHAHFSKITEKDYQLCISGWDDFNKLKELGVAFYHSKKARKWKEIFDSYKRHQISRNMAIQFYVQELKKLNTPMTARDFAKSLKKSKRTLGHYLTILMRKDFIRVDKTKPTYLYSA